MSNPDLPEGTEMVFTSVDVRNLDIVDKGASKKVLVYKQESPMTKEKEPKEKETAEVVKSVASKPEAKEPEVKTEETEVSKSEGDEPAASETSEAPKMSPSDILALAEQVVAVQKAAEAKEAEEKAAKEAELKKSETANETFAAALEVALKKSLAPLTDRLEALEGERGSRSAAESDEDVEIAKSEGGSAFQGMFPKTVG